MNLYDEFKPEDLSGLRAWEIDRTLRLKACPLDRRVNPSNWETMAGGLPAGDDLIQLFWGSRVPGSGAPEIPYVEMVQSMGNRGYDVRSAEALLPKGMQLASQGKADELRVLTAELLATLNDLPHEPTSRYWIFRHPAEWSDVLAAMPDHEPAQDPRALIDVDDKIEAGWLGQIAGGAFGTAIEGYHGTRIREVYGTIDSYITNPETMNDDVVYELVFLDVFGNLGRGMTSRDLGLEWIRQIPFGWSAEWIALQNLRNGIFPPHSGTFRNPYSEWIGAQMRGMICGMLAPGWPQEATRLAHLDARVSHSANGIYGEMYSAALTSLAFSCSDPRLLLVEASRYLPQGSEYVAVLDECLKTVNEADSSEQAWKELDERFQEYNWIHAYPNLAADVLALWYGGGDMTRSFTLLAAAGLDVDCNAGLVGNVLGIMRGVPAKWAGPIGNRLETYLKGKEVLSIQELARRTASLARIG